MTEREAFEAWAESKGLLVTRDASGTYWASSTEDRWDSWQASRKQALEEAAAAVTTQRGAMSMFVNSSEFRGHDAAISESLAAIRSLSTPEGGQ